jgi:hypothetical protein
MVDGLTSVSSVKTGVVIAILVFVELAPKMYPDSVWNAAAALVRVLSVSEEEAARAMSASASTMPGYSRTSYEAKRFKIRYAGVSRSGVLSQCRPPPSHPHDKRVARLGNFQRPPGGATYVPVHLEDLRDEVFHRFTREELLVLDAIPRVRVRLELAAVRVDTHDGRAREHELLCVHSSQQVCFVVAPRGGVERASRARTGVHRAANGTQPIFIPIVHRVVSSQGFVSVTE